MKKAFLYLRGTSLCGKDDVVEIDDQSYVSTLQRFIESNTGIWDVAGKNAFHGKSATSTLPHAIPQEDGKLLYVHPSSIIKIEIVESGE